MRAIGWQPHRRRMALRSTTNAIAPSRPRCTTFDEQSTRRLQLSARSLSDSRCALTSTVSACTRPCGSRGTRQQAAGALLPLHSRPCRIHLSPASESHGRLDDGLRRGDGAGVASFVRVGKICSKQARHANTAERA